MRRFDSTHVTISNCDPEYISFSVHGYEGSTVEKAAPKQPEGTDEVIPKRKKRTTKLVAEEERSEDTNVVSGKPTVPSGSTISSMIQGKHRSVLAVEILGNLTKFPHCILLTRVGQFYEVHFILSVRFSRLPDSHYQSYFD